MTQHPKQHVRERLLSSAATAFAELGVANTTMATVAKRSEVAVGNVYRYFRSKEQLLAEVIPGTFPTELRRIIRRRVESLGAARDVRSLPSDALYAMVSRQSVDYCIENRERVVILLLGARGTPFASFADDLARDLVEWAIDRLRVSYPTVRVSKVVRFVLDQIYRNYVAVLGRALAVQHDEREIRAAVAHISGYHLAGLRQLFEQCEAQSRAASRDRKSSK